MQRRMLQAPSLVSVTAKKKVAGLKRINHVTGLKRMFQGRKSMCKGYRGILQGFKNIVGLKQACWRVKKGLG